MYAGDVAIWFHLMSNSMAVPLQRRRCGTHMLSGQHPRPSGVMMRGCRFHPRGRHHRRPLMLPHRSGEVPRQGRWGTLCAMNGMSGMPGAPLRRFAPPPRCGREARKAEGTFASAPQKTDLAVGHLAGAEGFGLACGLGRRRL